MNITKIRNKALFEKLSKIENIELQSKRTLSIKSEIETAILTILEKNESVTKYKIHKATAISYQTLNKYYTDLLKDSIKKINDKRTLFL